MFPSLGQKDVRNIDKTVTDHFYCDLCRLVRSASNSIIKHFLLCYSYFTHFEYFETRGLKIPLVYLENGPGLTSLPLIHEQWRAIWSSKFELRIFEPRTFELFIPFRTKLGPMKRPELLNLLLKLHKTAWNIRLIQLWISRFFWWHKKDWCVAIIQVDFQPFGRVSRYCQFHLQNRQYQEIIDCNWKNHYAGHFSLNLNPYWQILENSSWNFSGRETEWLVENSSLFSEIPIFGAWARPYLDEFSRNRSCSCPEKSPIRVNRAGLIRDRRSLKRSRSRNKLISIKCPEIVLNWTCKVDLTVLIVCRCTFIIIKTIGIDR